MQSTTSFEREAAAALGSLQRSFSAALNAVVPWPWKAPFLARVLGLDRTLAWKLHRLVHEPTPTAAARFLPGAAGVSIVLDACAARGAPHDLVESAREAAEAYRLLVERHAGDRASAELMLSGLADEDACEGTLRRAAFRAASFVTGLQARTQLLSCIVARGVEPGTLDVAMVKALIDLRRLRAGAPFVVVRPKATDDRGGGAADFRWEPVDPPSEGVPRGLSPLVDFCSRPMPRFLRAREEAGTIEDELEPGPIGNAGAITWITADRLRAVSPAVARPDHERAEHAIRLRTPCEVAVLDVFAEVGVFTDDPAEVGVYSEHRGEQFRRPAERERYRVPVRVRAEELGHGPGAAATPDVPRYPAMAEHVLACMGWSGRRFELQRVRVEFPFTPTAVVLSRRLPPG